MSSAPLSATRPQCSLIRREAGLRGCAGPSGRSGTRPVRWAGYRSRMRRPALRSAADTGGLPRSWRVSGSTSTAPRCWICRETVTPASSETGRSAGVRRRWRRGAGRLAPRILRKASFPYSSTFRGMDPPARTAISCYRSATSRQRNWRSGITLPSAPWRACRRR